ncbi:M4 family metallopeptidase [Polaribacter cellanae]|uniref:M4 family metallopeptidase n=1 Tax=Polaribacter cellanae TaxID=2818493 RepID=A0A975CNJ6_9FLAO|nr:M4 family metallopeptidase [Polaribacter cellanae]QTE21815.1 M4 family metallopeptidase [Polaribacter cellanae]
MKTKHYILFGLIMLISSNLFSQVKQNEILSKDAKGIANFLKFKETKLESSDNAVKSFLKKQYNLNDNYEFKQKNNSLIIENGIKSQKLEQYYKGVKIAFSEIVVVSKNNNVKTINGKGLNIENINITPKLSESESLNHLLKKISAEKYAWEDNSYEELIKKETNDLLATNYPKGELVIIDKDLFDDIFEPILAYKFNVYATLPLSSSIYYVDASNGKLILENPLIKHVQGTAQTRYSGQRTIETQQNGSSYRLRDYSRGSGIETYNMNNGTNYNSATDFTDNDNNWTSSEYNNSNKDNAALDAHWGAEKTYDYFLEKHNRNSYDNNGSKIKSYVHTNLVGLGRPNNDNAFWDPTYKRMTYGDGQYLFDALTSIDVVAHEIGHAVCSSTADLYYGNESGAINEGLSDIWGAMVEYHADTTKQTYEIGEEIKLGGGSLRSMSNPNSRNQPDTYKGDYWYWYPSNPGYGEGVHTNSGVLNYWFYLLAEGGNGTNDIGNVFNVNGIGKEKASKIVYRAESIYFTSSTTYSQARQLTIQAAEDLYGENSIESASTCQSWYAVGVGDNSCNVDIELTGNSTICNTSNYTYTLNYTPPNSSTNWSVTSGIQIINSNNSSITINSINSSFNGMATITASISGTIIKKDIWIGKPKFTFEIEPVGINYIHVNMIGYNSSDITKQGITSTTWQKISGSGGCYSSFYGNNFFGSGNGNCNSWVAYAKITATNVCGTTTIYRHFTPPAPNPCNNITFNGQSIVIEDPCNNFNGIAGNSNSIKSILIYNLMGKQVSNNNDLSILSKGIYIIKVELTTGEILTKKIIK